MSIRFLEHCLFNMAISTMIPAIFTFVPVFLRQSYSPGPLNHSGSLVILIIVLRLRCIPTQYVPDTNNFSTRNVFIMRTNAISLKNRLAALMLVSA